MPLRLRVVPSGKSTGRARKPTAEERAIEFDDGVGQIRIGRRADLELSLPFSPLSGVHARLVRAGSKDGAGAGGKPDDGGWLLEDLGSTNGTFVGGERLKPGVKRLVTAGTQIALAQVKLIFDGEVPGSDATATYVSRQISDKFSPGPMGGTAPFLAVVTGVKGGETFRFAQRNHHYVIGRGKGCDFRIKDDQASREHATFTWRDQGVVEVADLGSANGVLVNGEQALGPTRLYDGDLVQVAEVKMRFFNPIESAEHHSDALAAEAVGVRATPSSATAAVDLSSTFRSRLHPAVGGALSAERVQRPVAERLPADDRTYRSRSPASIFLMVIAGVVVLAVAALVGGLTAR